MLNQLLVKLDEKVKSMAVVQRKMIKLTLLIKKIDEGEFDTEYLEAKKEFIEGLLKAVGELREGLETDKEVDTDKTVDGLIEKDKENE